MNFSRVACRPGAKRWPLIQLLVVLGLCGAPASAPAQETVNYASVSGRVTDPQGAVVAGAQVSARQTETNIARTAVTDAEGRFRFPYLRLGPYEIVVRSQGFSDATRRLNLTVGSAFDLPIALKLEAVAESVTVTGTATVLESARSQIAGTVSQAEVASLPLNGRNFLDIALLVPGVSPTNVGGTQLFAETSAVPGVGLSVGSQRNFSNNFIVDGLSANDDAAGLSGMPYGVDAVDQFQVVTSGGQAELGRALGGYVNVVTKSGTNASRGDLYGYFRDDAFNGRNALSGTEAADVAEAVRRKSGRADRQRPLVLLRQRRAAPAGSDRADDDQRRATPRSSTPGLRPSVIRDRGFRRAIYPNPGAQRERARQDRSPVQSQRSLQRALQLV